MRYWVYVHTCKDNGKRYVGVTTKTKPEYRWREGNGYRYNKHFYSAILKHGWNNFQHEVFEVDSKEEMYRKEVELISFYHSNDPKFGYNNSVGGEKSSLGCKCSEETRRKISEANKGKPRSEEVRRKNSEARKKRWLDPEYRKHMSEVHKGKSVSEEQRKKISETQKKRCLDPEVRRKRSEDHKKKWTDPEYREKVSKALKGKSRSAETREKMAEAIKKSHSDSGYKKKMSEISKNWPRVKIKLQDGTVLEVTKQVLTRWYINKGKKFEYVD